MLQVVAFFCSVHTSQHLGCFCTCPFLWNCYPEFAQFLHSNQISDTFISDWYTFNHLDENGDMPQTPLLLNQRSLHAWEYKSPFPGIQGNQLTDFLLNSKLDLPTCPDKSHSWSKSTYSSSLLYMPKPTFTGFWFASNLNFSLAMLSNSLDKWRDTFKKGKHETVYTVMDLSVFI